MFKNLGKFLLTFTFLFQLFPIVKASNFSVNNIGRRIIAHYAAQGDTMKLKAAKFIVKNMAYHYSYM